MITLDLARLFRAPRARRTLPPLLAPGVRMVRFDALGTPRVMSEREALSYARARLSAASSGTIEVDE